VEKDRKPGSETPAKGKPVKAKPVKAKPAKVKAAKPAPLGITKVDLVTVFPDEPASCSFESASGRLTLRIPQALDGPPGPEGPQGKTGKGIDYSQAPGGKDAFFLFVDKEGRLCYSARGSVFRVILEPVGPGIDG
jgi:hypothetical protein